MKRLLYIEWLKNYSYKPVRIFAIIYFGIISLLLLLSIVEFDLGPFTINLKEQGFFEFPGLWNFMTYIASILKIFLGMIIIFTITHEFSNKLFKQNLIDGLSRKEYLISKLLTISVLTVFSTLFVLVVGLILGLFNSEVTTLQAITKELYFVGGYFLKLFTFFSFLLFLSILLRKSIFVLLVFFIWWIFEGIVQICEVLARNFSNGKMNENQSEIVSKIYASDYLPLNAMGKLIELPIERVKIAESFGASYEYSVPYGHVVACIIYSVLFILGSYYIIKKRDF